MHRRRFLATAGAVALAGLAGCTTGDGGDGGDPTTADTATDTTTTQGSDGTPIGDHPAAAGLADQPVRGDLGGNVVVAFADPSCPRCRAFETGTVPRIQAELVETGRAAYVYRNYPVVYPWGKPATQALEATFDRSDDAFWTLLAHYYHEQSSFTTSNASASPLRSIRRARSRPGRLSVFADAPASTMTSTSSRSYREA